MKIPASVTPIRAARLFALSNIAFLGVDIALAHETNEFARRVEWAPIVFSAVAALLLAPGAFGRRGRVAALLELLAGWGAVATGVIGMALHLESGFFAKQTLHDLVYSAPFVAPLSYVGVGLLILLLRSEEADGEAPLLGTWILVLALGGFVGNFLLSVLDHAQNGFFHVTEWIPVASAAYAIGFLVVALAKPGALPPRVLGGAMLLQVVVGAGGFVLHVMANLGKPAPSLLDRFVFGAPAFAPLLFADLAVLAGIGMWARQAARLPRQAMTPSM